MHTAAKSWFVRSVAALVVVGAVAAGCGGDSEEGGGDDSNATEDALGETNEATGEPVTIGFVSDGQSAAIDNTAEIEAAEAAVSYLNEYQGGLNGRPIELKVCETGQTPAGAADCATEMVAAEVPVVLSPVSGQGGTVFEGLNAEGIPFVMLGSVDTAVMTQKGAYVFSNPLGSLLAAPAGIARDNGVERAAVVVIDVPDASGPVKSLGDTFYTKAGVKLDVVTVPPGTPDMTPQIQAEMENDPGQFAVVGDVTFCTSALKAIRTLNFDGTIVVIPQCIDDSTNDAVPGGVEGLTIVTSTKSDGSDPSYATYEAAMEKYAEGTDTGAVAVGAYQLVLSLVDALGAIEEVTPDGVKAALDSMEPTPLALGGGIMLQCNGQQVAITPNACTTAVLTATLDADGNATDFKELDTKDLTDLGG